MGNHCNKSNLVHASNGTIIATKATDMQLKFVELVSRGLSQTEAARTAGYTHPDRQGYTLMQIPHIASAIRVERERVIQGDLGSLGLVRLKKLLQDDDTPAHVAFQAARWVLEAGGQGSVNKKEREATVNDKPLSELTVQELDELIAKGKEMAKNMEYIDINAPNDAQNTSSS